MKQSKEQSIRQNKKQSQKSQYNMWQNTIFMLKNAWHVCKSVIFICVVLAAVTAGKTIAEMLIAPAILEKVETTAPLTELLAVIAEFGIILVILAGLKEYLERNTMFGRIAVRSFLVRKVGSKNADTSYPNTLDTDFINFENKASHACSGNAQATEVIWKTWTLILTNIAGFVVYLLLLSSLNPLLICLVVVTTMIGYFVSKRINGWGYRHREEEAAYGEKMGYIRRVSTQRYHAKDIRIFGLQDWLEDVWYSTLDLYRAFLAKRERVYIWTNIVELILTLLRNGIAYLYLIRITLEHNLPASEFLLYFSAVNGFTQWVTGIMEEFMNLHKQSLDISLLREFLEWPEPFKFEEGIPLKKDLNQDYEIRLEDVSFRYPEADRDTISHMNLTIHPGEKLAIVGLNGAGKTTLVKLVCGFLAPCEGKVLLNGEDIRQYNRRDYYKLFSSVFQDFSVLEGTIAENVAQQVNDIEADRVWDCLEKAGLSEKVHLLPNGLSNHIGRQVYEDGIEMSGGQIQRLMLARALYKNAPVIYWMNLRQHWTRLLKMISI